METILLDNDMSVSGMMRIFTPLPERVTACCGACVADHVNVDCLLCCAKYHCQAKLKTITFGALRNPLRMWLMQSQ